jgi:hypothetical protein
MLADVDVATRVNVHMPWFGKTGSRRTQNATGSRRIVVLQCGSVNPPKHPWKQKDLHESFYVFTPSSEPAAPSADSPTNAVKQHASNPARAWSYALAVS